MMLEIGGRLRETLCRHLEAAYPEEGCGLLLGRRAPEADVVLEVVPVENAHEARRRAYRIAPEDVLAAERRARGAGGEIVGFYHSHPDRPASPSPADRREAWPGTPYVIASVTAGRVTELGAFTLPETGGGFVPLRLAGVEDEGA